MGKKASRFDDYEYDDYAASRGKPGKGHKRDRGPSWEDEVLSAALDASDAPSSGGPQEPQKRPSEPRGGKPWENARPGQGSASEPRFRGPRPEGASPRPFQPGPNSREIRGSTIDFARLAGIEAEEGTNPHNGRPSHGIRFLFTGRKGLSRTVWFGWDLAARDACLAESLSYWEEVKALPNGGR